MGTFPSLILYLFLHTLSKGLWFRERPLSFKTFKLKDQISHLLRHQPLIPLLSLGSCWCFLADWFCPIQVWIGNLPASVPNFLQQQQKAGGGRKRTHRKTSWVLLVVPGYPHVTGSLSSTAGSHPLILHGPQNSWMPSAAYVFQKTWRKCGSGHTLRQTQKSCHLKNGGWPHVGNHFLSEVW